MDHLVISLDAKSLYGFKSQIKVVQEHSNPNLHYKRIKDTLMNMDVLAIYAKHDNEAFCEHWRIPLHPIWTVIISDDNEAL